MRPDEAAGESQPQEANRLEAGMHVRRQVVVQVTRAIALVRPVPLAVIVHPGRAFELGVPLHERSLAAQGLEVEIEVEQVGLIDRAASRDPVAQAIPPQIPAPVADAGTEPLARAHPAQDQLRAVGTLPRIEPFPQPAFDEPIHLIDERRLSLRPEFGFLLLPLLPDDIRARLGFGLRRSRRRDPYRENQAESTESEGCHSVNRTTAAVRADCMPDQSCSNVCGSVGG